MELATTYHPQSPFPNPPSTHMLKHRSTQTHSNNFVSMKYSEMCPFHQPEPDAAATEMLSCNQTLLRQSIVCNTTAVWTFVLAKRHVFLVHYEAV